MPRSKTHLLTPFIALTALTPCLWPQTRVPTVYSYIQDPATGIMGSSVVKVARDGPKEAIDQILPVGPGRAKEFHNQHRRFRTQAHSQSHRHHPPARCQLHRSLPGQHPAHGKHHR
jgi:hypothetical protein